MKIVNDTMGVILTRDSESELGGLTSERAEAAVPFAGRYRIIDFILSSVVNSGIHNVGVVTNYNYQSLLDHLGSGKEWDLGRKLSGLFILPPHVRRGAIRVSSGNIEELYRVMYYLHRSKEKYVLLSEKNVICNMTFDDAMDFHMAKEADITLIYNNLEERRRSELTRITTVEVDSNSQVTNLEVQPRFARSNNASMGIYITHKILLENLIEECISNGLTDFEFDLLKRNIGNLRIFGYQYDGFVMRLDSVRSYFRNSLALTDKSTMDKLFSQENLIYTKVKDEVPTRYGENAKISNCLIADGCNIDGEVSNSILFRGVNISKRVKITNSIIMQGSEIHENSTLENVILDKDVIVRVGKRLTGQPDFPVVISKGGVV